MAENGEGRRFIVLDPRLRKQATRTISWGAVLTAVAMLGALANYYGCVPVMRSQIAPVIQQGNEIHRLQFRNDQHIDRDLGRIMKEFGLEHDDGHLEQPPELHMRRDVKPFAPPSTGTIAGETHE